MPVTNQAKKWTSILWKFVFLIVSVCVVSYMLRHFITQPGEVMTEIGGDAAKNYYTVIYQALYGYGFWFDGMNYPYGEHSTFVDGQPLLAASLAFLRQWVPLSVSSVLAIMHLLIAFSYVLAILFVYKILRFYGLPGVMCGLFAILIIAMSPQVGRAFAHFGLSYACFLPMLFYWLLLYNDRRSWKYPVYIAVTGLAASLLHGYWAGIYMVWCGLYAMSFLIINRSPFTAKAKHVGILLAAIGIMLVSFKLIILATDRVADRPSEPAGFFQHTAYTKDIVTSSASPIWTAVKKAGIITDISPLKEGYAYIGISAMLILACWCVVWGLMYLRRGANQGLLPGGEKPLSWIWVLVALGGLMLGSGAPFIWNMEWLLDYVSVMRHFRSLGRFCWIFYYITVIYAAVCCWRMYLRAVATNRKALATAVLAIPVLLWTYEAKGIADYFRLKSNNMPDFKHQFFGEGEYENWSKVLASHQRKPSDFQAVMMLPFFHVGSDKLMVQNYHTEWIAGLTERATMNLRLPMVNLMASRSSWSQTFAQVRTAAGPYAIKQLLNDLPNSKPILTLVYRGDSINRDEAYLLQSADYIGEILNCGMYALYPDRLRASDSTLRSEAWRIAASMLSGDTCIGAQGNTWTVLHYDSTQTSDKVWGNGSLPLKGDWMELIQMPVHPVGDTVYEVSIWVKVNDRNADAPALKIYVIDSVGTYWTDYEYYASRSTDFNGFWFRISAYIPVPRHCRLLKCVIQKGSLGYRLDELMIRPASATIISRSSNSKTIMVNNHILTTH